MEASHLPYLDLEPALLPGLPLTSEDTPSELARFEQMQREWERDVLMRALALVGGNKTKAAQALGMSIRNFYYKLERQGLAQNKERLQ